MKNLFIALWAVMISLQCLAQKTLTGFVYEMDSHGIKSGLPSASISWTGTSLFASTDMKGWFTINKPADEKRMLVVSYIGYKKDTLSVPASADTLEIQLKLDRILKEVVVQGVIRGSYLSRISPILTNVITSNELKKAACCNLSESFETNPSVDVNYTDAVSGIKQIMLLGLSGSYVQMMIDNLPSYRGISANYGLEYIPGPWMQSIQVSKGASNVVNGFESITGQINTELKKPEGEEKFQINLYENDLAKTEVNVHKTLKVNERWKTILLAHADYNDYQVDHNKDGFLDIPLAKGYNFENQWVRTDTLGNITHAGFGALYEERLGGQKGVSKDQPHDSLHPYGISITNKRYRANLKQGYLFRNAADASIALMTNVSYHSQDAYFGLNSYAGIQKSYYGNLVYQSIFSNTLHKYSTGLSFMYDDYSEKLNDSVFKKSEVIPGAYFQYTYTKLDKLTLIAGIRADYHNLYGLFFTPRVHLKYNLNKNNILRASAGKGYRTPNMISENLMLLESSRKLMFTGNVQQEKAWNYGINYSRYMKVFRREMNITIDAYRTDFQEQMIVNLDEDPRYAFISNLEGRSFANVAQVEIRYELIKHLDLVAAFRINDVHVTENDQLRTKPFVSKYKGLINLSYKTSNRKWQFDFTSQFNGASRLPESSEMPKKYRQPSYSPEYTILFAQISRYFKHWNIYAGCENITDFVQKNPIVAADNPFGSNFDASMVWGPVIGRKFYAGIRYTIK